MTPNCLFYFSRFVILSVRSCQSTMLAFCLIATPLVCFYFSLFLFLSVSNSLSGLFLSHTQASKRQQRLSLFLHGRTGKCSILIIECSFHHSLHVGSSFLFLLSPYFFRSFFLSPLPLFHFPLNSIDLNGQQ